MGEIVSVYEHFGSRTASRKGLSSWTEVPLYRVIHKSLRDFRPLRYSSQDGHAEGEHVNRERETLQVSALPYRCSICAPLVTRQMSNFGKFQDTDCLLIPCPRHVSSRLPPSGETCKYATAPNKKKLGETLCLLICFFLPCLSWLLRSRVRKSRRDLWITLYIYNLFLNTADRTWYIAWSNKNINSSVSRNTFIFLLHLRSN
jgi:hypothetical protein